MTWMPQTWGDAAAVAAVLTVIATMFYFGLRAKLDGDFVPRDELMGLHKQNVAAIEELHVGQSKMGHRMSNVEQKLLTLPTRQDLQRLDDKVASVSQGVGELTGMVRGLGDGIGRNFTQLQLLTQAKLSHEGDD